MHRILVNRIPGAVSRKSLAQNLLIFGPSSIVISHICSNGSSHACTYSQKETLSVVTPNARPASLANQRRSQRVLLSVTVIISGKRENGSSFTERTRTLVVNAHGALLLLREPVTVDQVLSITNVATGEALVCNVKDINFGQRQAPEIGIEFAQPSPRFWRVSFPPPGWTSHSPEAKRFGKSTIPPANLTPQLKK